MTLTNRHVPLRRGARRHATVARRGLVVTPTPHPGPGSGDPLVEALARSWAQHLATEALPESAPGRRPTPWPSSTPKPPPWAATSATACPPTGPRDWPPPAPSWTRPARSWPGLIAVSVHDLAGTDLA